MAFYLPTFRIAKWEGDPLSERENGFRAESAGWWEFGAGGGLTGFLSERCALRVQGQVQKQGQLPHSSPTTGLEWATRLVRTIFALT